MTDIKIKTAFVFSGVGGQWIGMGTGLLDNQVFLQAVRECDDVFQKISGWRVEDQLRQPVESSKLSQLEVAYACNYVLQIALTRLLKANGITPDAVIGHSGGETVAAYVAGILPLEDVFAVVLGQADTITTAPEGAMAHIGLPGQKVEEILKQEKFRPDVYITACNSPKATIVGGPKEKINLLVDSLIKDKTFCRLVKANSAYHTPFMEPTLENFREAIKHIRIQSPYKQPVIYSSMQGGKASGNAYDVPFWLKFMLAPVRFLDAVENMLKDGCNRFIEVNPHPILAQNIKEILEHHGVTHSLVTEVMKRDEDQEKTFAACLKKVAHLQSGENTAPESAPGKTIRAGSGEFVDKIATLTGKEREEAVIRFVKQAVSDATAKEVIPPEDTQVGFFEMGLDSGTAVKFQALLGQRLGLDLSVTLAFDYPDIDALSGYLLSLLFPVIQQASMRLSTDENKSNHQNEPIAVIGMACRFPGGANSPDAFWEMLEQGRGTVADIPKERWDADAYYGEETEAGKSVTKRANFLKGVDIKTFDAAFFNISPKEAEAMDPQQRLLLEASVEALENAAVAPTSVRDDYVGVFVGMATDDYKKAHLLCEDLRTIDAYSGTGSMISPPSGRISYFLGLRGPCMTIDTACSSSITALHLASRALRNGECRMALAGGVNCMLIPNHFVYASQLQALSKDGTCKTFDENADGYGRGEGTGMLLLKPLSQALDDNDNILAIIKGSAINQDGASTGLTVPNGISQQEVYRRALEDSRVSPKSVDYVEAHGSGTPLGDPIEIGSLNEVYGKHHTMDNPLLVGAVKTNIGHTEAAAGSAGVIKTILALQHDVIPPHIRFSTPNSFIPWERMAVKVNAGLTFWKRGQNPRRAGVSSFGFSGSNAHLILEEAPLKESKKAAVSYPVQVLNLSAKSEIALTELVQGYIRFLSGNNPPPFEDICYTAAVGRSHYKYRTSFPAASIDKMIPKLKTHSTAAKNATTTDTGNGKIVFLFTGQGSQYPGMGKGLYDVHPVFKETLDRCSKLFEPHISTSLKDLLYGVDTTEETLDRALYAQPAIFSVETALAALWKSFGVEPAAVLGHSIGEYAAACFAGVFILEDAVNLVAARALSMEANPVEGKMVGILTGEEKVNALLKDYPDVSIAAVNAAQNVTISGGTDSLEAILKKVKQEKIFVERLNISHPFHSVNMEPHARIFRERIEEADVTFSKPSLTFVSIGCNGKGNITDPNYWSQHICQPVRFYDGIKQLEKDGFRLFLEVGGTAALAGLAGQCMAEENALFLASLRKGREPWMHLLKSLSALYTAGIDIDWNGFYEPPIAREDREIATKITPVSGTFQTRKTQLPTYPFQRTRYWKEHLNKTPVPGVDRPASLDTSLFQNTADNAALKVPTGSTTGNGQAGGPGLDVKEIGQQIKKSLIEMLNGISGLEPGQFEEEGDLIALGLDSLMLIEFRRKINGKYGVDITLNEFFTSLGNLESISAFVTKQLPPEAPLPTAPPPIETSRENDTMYSSQFGHAPIDAGGGLPGKTVVERIMNKQMQAMKELARKQLEILRKMPRQADLPAGTRRPREQTIKKAGPHHEESVPMKTSAPKPLNFKATANLSKRGLDEGQQAHLDALIERYIKRTRASKENAAKYRRVLSDSKATVGFNKATKEMLYPLVGNRSEGSRFWDIDDNEYIDLTMGFGVYLFGHQPPFVAKARKQQPGNDVQLGPRSYLVGEVAEAFCRITGLERVTFTNSGTEANMAAIRLARAVTGRSKIAMFTRSYHGHSDGTLAVASFRDGKPCSEPVSIGIPQGVVDDVIVLDYLAPKSLDTLRSISPQLAAVIVEPVQSRFPNVEPRDFLNRLREITKQTGSLLMFDEMITGFRFHQGGAQAYFGVRADICTYGKIIGGGMPIGVLAGKAEYMDHIDGGYWQYGDDSYPSVERTFFGGTYCQHHDSLVTAHAVLKELEEKGPALQEELNLKTQKFAETLNTYFEKNDISIHISYFSSIFRFEIQGGMDLFYFHMIEKGVYIWEWRNCFLSTAHSDDDLEFIIRAVKETVQELEAGGFSMRKKRKKGAGQKKDTTGGYTVPMSSVQKRLFVLSRTPESQRAYFIPIAFDVTGPLDIERTEAVFKSLIKRHHILRTGLELENDQFIQRVHEDVEFSIGIKKDKSVEAAISLLMSPFDLARPPLMRVVIVETAPSQFLLLVNYHHAVVDGTSATVLARDFMELYNDRQLPPV
ncbi:MAG: aminotransferase class III-fold pyridoxal phosphate-dependent enzyme, partial [bacterium]|nr:aminotransferase class III-fold pyridoxal phosphate-dependent enzyme [bacterium]